MSLLSWIRDEPRYEAENVTLPELISLGRIDRMWNGRRPTHLVWTEDRLWKRGLLEKFRSWDRKDQRWFIWYEITPAGYAMLERKRAEWRERQRKKKASVKP